MNYIINLIFHCDILINPSLFEGWSTTVEEAKLFDKKMILSDIKVHNDQAVKNTLFLAPILPKSNDHDGLTVNVQSA